MQLLVFVVQRCGNVKVTQDVLRGLPGLFIAAVSLQVLLQTGQEGQRALHTFVAGT